MLEVRQQGALGRDACDLPDDHKPTSLVFTREVVEIIASANRDRP